MIHKRVPAPLFKAPTPWPSLPSPLFKNFCFPSPLFLFSIQPSFKVFQFPLPWCWQPPLLPESDTPTLLTKTHRFIFRKLRMTFFHKIKLLEKMIFLQKCNKNFAKTKIISKCKTINLEILNRKSASPLFKKTCPCTILPPFLFF